LALPPWQRQQRDPSNWYEIPIPKDTVKWIRYYL
jgi:hypothetical protein